MRKGFAFLLIFAAALIEATLFGQIQIFNTRPQLLLILVILFSFIFELRWAIFFAVLAGLLKDALSINYFGLHTLAFSLWGFVGFKISKNFSVTSFSLVPPLIVLIICLANSLIIQLMLLYANQNFLFMPFLKNIFLEPLYSTVISLIIFRLAKDLKYLQKL